MGKSVIKSEKGKWIRSSEGSVERTIDREALRSQVMEDIRHELRVMQRSGLGVRNGR